MGYKLHNLANGSPFDQVCEKKYAGFIESFGGFNLTGNMCVCFVCALGV